MLLLRRSPRARAPAERPPAAKRRARPSNLVVVRHPPRHHHSSRSIAASASLSSWLAYPPTKAALLTGAYALVAGGALVAAPAATLAILAPVAASTTPPGLIRLGGLILATFGAQYALAAWHERGAAARGSADAFYRASVPSRLALAAALAALAAFGQVERGVLVLAALNATGALSMRRALQRAGALGAGRGS